MKIWKNITVSALLILVMGIFSCENPATEQSEYDVSVTGKVVRLAVSSGIDSVIVRLDSKDAFAVDTTDSFGNFSMSFKSKEDATTAATFTLTHMNLSYVDTTYSGAYSRKSPAIDLGQLKMRGKSTSFDSIITGKASAPAKSIAFLSSTLAQISVFGTGNDATNITFEVRDSLGVPVDEANKTPVVLTVETQPDTVNSVTIKPDTAVTNSLGQVVFRLTSGPKSGIITLKASSRSKKKNGTDSINISSKVVSIVVAGGIPDPTRFTIGSQKVNIPGLVKYDLRNTITAVVGDKFGNPVQKGTVVYFETNGGIIQAYSTTNLDGSVGVDLITGNPPPPSGVATITALVGTTGGGSVQGNGMNEEVILKPLRSKRQGNTSSTQMKNRSTRVMTPFSKQITMIFSGEPIIKVPSADSTFFSVPLLGSKQIEFRVADIYNHPMAEGTVVTVTGVGLDTTGAVLSGDVTKILPDTRDSAFTKFFINVSDKRNSNLNNNVALKLIVEVNGPNGTAKRTISGILTSGISDSGKVDKLSFVNGAAENIVVSGAGLKDSVVVQAMVLDSKGAPSPGIPVIFSILQSVGGGEYMTNPLAVTGANGIASTTLFAGVRSGIVQLQASIKRDLLSINSEIKTVYIKTGPLYQIKVVSASESNLSVKDGGGIENSLLVYEAQDILGNAIDSVSTIKFSMFGDITGAKLSPDSVKTDPNTGRVTTSFTAGSKSGIVQIKATNKNGSIVSPTASLTISGGYPVDSLFFVGVSKKNYSHKELVPAEISVIAGDKAGNPVKSGTPIYFTTDGGIITATAFTDNLGKASSLLLVQDATPGNYTITAKTIGAVSTEIIRKIPVLISGDPIISTNISNDTITLFDGSSSTVDFTISDTNGYPISSNHTYEVSVEGAVASQIGITGDQSDFIIDSNEKNKGTNFTIAVRDLMENSGTGGMFKIKIQVTGPTSSTTYINGKLLAPSNIIVPPSARVPASIALLTASSNDISIAGVGGTENATLTFEVRDSVGAPITLDNRATVIYSTNFFPNTFTVGGTYPVILPTIDSTDENGKTRVSITSGTQAGVLQLEALINLTNPVRTIKSQPVIISVNSGFADQGHFTIAPTQFNFPGLQKAFLGTDITVQVGDKYSNPVKEGTAVYFNSAHGIIQTAKGLTDKNGFVTMTLYAGNPFPNVDGFSYVYARTIGKDSSFVMDSVQLLWSGSPIITKTDVINSITVPNGGSAGPFTFTVEDYLGNPMSQGVSIAIEASGLSVSGNANVTMPDTKVGGAGLTSFTFTVTDASPTDTDAPVATLITIVVSHPVYGTYKLVTASGTVD
ncbi:MAG: Ig-like domain-containing protein [Bacteroidota bacterium]